MGIYLNPGNEGFKIYLDGKIYVDKTGLIAHTNECVHTPQRYICVSRPRRFGKSMAAEMLAAYYDRNCDSHALFDGLEIAKDPSYETHLNRYNVIKIDINDALYDYKNADDMVTGLQGEITSEIKRTYRDIEYTSGTFADVLRETYEYTGIAFIFIIDEWDAVLRKKRDNPEMQKSYLDFLGRILKGKEYVTLAYMTGILPIKKYGEHSALNMFTEVSMITDRQLDEGESVLKRDTVPGDETYGDGDGHRAFSFAPYMGFTEEEVMSLCKRYNRSYEDIKAWYNGYDIEGMSIYNPKSVVDSLMQNRLTSFWTQTETYEALRIYIDSDTYGMYDKTLRLIAGEEMEADVTGFQNDMVTFKSADDVMTLLVHLGYLTYDCRKKTVRIPNKEVRDQFKSTVKKMGWEDVVSSLNNSEELLKATRAGDAEKVAKYLDIAHTENSSVLKYNDENSLACVIALAYHTARKDYTVIREMPAGRGFADMVFLPKKGSYVPCMVIELKCDEAAGTAIEQIKERRYIESLKDFGGEIYLVGISYGKGTKRHSCRIEKITK